MLIITKSLLLRHCLGARPLLWWHCEFFLCLRGNWLVVLPLIVFLNTGLRCHNTLAMAFVVLPGPLIGGPIVEETLTAATPESINELPDVPLTIRPHLHPLTAELTRQKAPFNVDTRGIDQFAFPLVKSLLPVTFKEEIFCRHVPTVTTLLA
jgi:hypothetical protein